MMLKLDLVMPMAGEGKRVKGLNQDVRKPFILVNKIELYKHALNSINKVFEVQDKVAILPMQETKLPDFNCINTPLTRGPLESALLGVRTLSGNRPFAILDCDLCFTAESQLSNLSGDAAIFTFTSQLDRYSYALVDGDHVSRVVEKKVISNNAIAGCYVFKSKDLFISCANAILKEIGVQEEPYLSHLLSDYIAKGKDVRAHQLSDHISLGTADEIKRSGFKF